jgi:hypothetical protein
MSTRRRKKRLERQGAATVEGERLYRLSQVADAANLSVRTVQNHVEKGALKVRRIGPYRHPRVTESELKKYLDEDNQG